ncbi:MAG: cadherin repeat domain-containing protein, partial [Bacteroidales bacterium]|nr:cadherin repeat domain-containing protein [Bacteroidales bacterium]
AFAEVTQVLLVDESAEKGTEVGTISAKSDAAPKYSFVTDLDFDDYKYFDIDGSTGVITVKDESLADFNTKNNDKHIK